MRKNKTTHFMAGILILVFVCVFLVLTGRFLYIQAVGEINGVDLAEWAEKKRSSDYTLHADRGKIFDNNGMTLAYDRPTFRIYAILDEAYTGESETPKHVKDPEKTAELLAPLLDLDESKILQRLKDGIEQDQFQTEFGKEGKELSQQTKDKIEEMDIPGINFEKESIRYYPNGMFASHILGFARKESGKITGMAGIENEMNDILSGKDGYISYQRDKYNKKLLHPDEVIKKPKDGKDIHLTIDQKIQTLLEDVLSQVDKEYEPKRLTAIVMDPKTGEIVAMGNRPGYNPNNPADVKNWYNDAIANPFEPGSTMKMFTWAAAIEEGVYKGDETYKSGKYEINDKMPKIRDHNDGEGWGEISYDEGFARSSNVAAAKLAWEKVGADKFLDYLKNFDLDKKTNIDLPDEVPGSILYNWPLEKVTTSFGQGSTVTPIQQLKAMTAIANDGKMLQPYVIKKITDPSTKKLIEEKSPNIVGEPISKETADQVKDLLGSVVDSKHGTGKMFQLDDYSVAGKTGTAQIPNPDGAGYLTGHDNYTFSFMGMAPKDDPQLVMFVSVTQPDLETEDGYVPGSTPVSFIFKNVMENGLHYMDINPDQDENDPVHRVKVPELTGENTADAEEELAGKGLHVTVIGSGEKVVDVSAEEGNQLLQNDRIILLTDEPAMPDITGWSQRDVMQLADLLHLKLETDGDGYVVRQSIEKDKEIKKEDYLGVELEHPAADNDEDTETEDGSEQEDEEAE